MQIKVFSIFDEKGKCFGVPFFVEHNGVALRMFSDLVQDTRFNINKHPSDYKLYCLATFDNVVGSFDSLDIPEFLANASDFASVVPSPVETTVGGL